MLAQKRQHHKRDSTTSSDTVKDDELPKLEGKQVELLTTTVQRVRRVIDEKIKSEIPSP